MTKLDIAKAIGGTFAFLFGNIAAVLRIIWLPVVVQLAAFFLLMPGYARATAGLAVAFEPEEQTAAAAAALPGYGLLALFLIAIFLTSVVMVVGLTRLALSQDAPRGPFYIGWGKDEMRVAGGWLLFALIVAGLIIVMQVGGLLLGMMLGAGPLITVIILVVNVVLACIICMVCVRLSLLAPATIVRAKISLGDSWERTDDDFWNFLGFWLLLFVMFAILYAVLFFTVILPPGFFQSFAGATDEDSIREATRKANDLMVESYNLSDIGNVVRLTIGALFGPIVSVILFIAGATAWKVTTSEA